jgi:hypothetical protein
LVFFKQLNWSSYDQTELMLFKNVLLGVLNHQNMLTCMVLIGTYWFFVTFLGFTWLKWLVVHYSCYSLQSEVAVDMRQRYVGHCNTGTDIKQASFLGERGIILSLVW